MTDPRNIIRLPMVTEKGTTLRTTENTYVFKVDPRANKIQIAGAVKAIFKVEVESVRTSNILGKPKRMGRHEGKRSDWKKAYVTLKKDQKIEIFEEL